jgi:DMSO/TMAO reductase YedYZ heme-binding membrane subunit
VNGWILVLWTALLVGAGCVVALVSDGTGIEGVSQVLRLTARTSLVLFSLAFGARAASRLWGIKWPLGNRRYLGVSFAVSHTYHLVGIVALAVLVGWPRFVAGTGTSLYLGAVGYVLIAAMVATSFDRTSAWLGRRRWKILHSTGMYALGAFFALTYVGGALASPRPLELGLAALSMAAPALRVAAAVSRRRARRALPQPTQTP